MQPFSLDLDEDAEMPARASQAHAAEGRTGVPLLFRHALSKDWPSISEVLANTPGAAGAGPQASMALGGYVGFEDDPCLAIDVCCTDRQNVR